MMQRRLDNKIADLRAAGEPASLAGSCPKAHPRRKMRLLSYSKLSRIGQLSIRTT